MKNYLWKMFFRIISFSVLSTFMLSFIFQNSIIQHGKNMRDCFMPFFSELLLSIVCFLLSLTSATIFINLFNRKKLNNTFVFSTFTVLPFIVSLLFIFYSIFENNNGIYLFIFALLFPFWTLLIWEYFKFNKIRMTFDQVKNI